MGISAVLITKDEEDNLERCLKSLSWVDEIVLVDSGSQDKTVEIAELAGAKVFMREFDTFSNQKNFGNDQATYDWVLSIDADEVVTDKLKEAVQKASGDPGKNSGFYIIRKNYFFGKNLRFGGQGSERILRLFKRDEGRFEQPIHEKVVVNGSVGELEGDLLHYSTQTMKDYQKKLQLYTDQEAALLKKQCVKPSLVSVWIKPCLRFVYYYIFRLGFLDGFAGLYYHVLSAYYFHIKFVKLKKIQ